MFLEDLEAYRYCGRFTLRGVRAVGWLAAGRLFTAGETPRRIVEKLSWLATMRPVNQMRGYHRCELCSRVEIPIEVDGVARMLGSAEIWVPGEGELFASPDLIVHYVLVHRYVPPLRFVEAVHGLDLLTWDPPRDYGLELHRRSLQT